MAGPRPAYAAMADDSIITGGFWSGKSANFSIRPYRNADRAKIRHICCETGFLGNPIDAIFCDRELFADLMVNPYLDYAEDWAYVATHDGRAVGYLLGAPPSFDRYMVYAGSVATLRMLLKSVSGAYAHHPRSSQFVEWLLTRSFRERPCRPRRAAHMHFNVLPGFRGHGLGRRLWRAFEERLSKTDNPRYYGELFSCKSHHPERAYQRYGVGVYDRAKTTIFAGSVSEDVFNICVVKELH
ncbi:GNAT family N-acetyltransferase [Acidithiobacillus sulfuriphilus]|uniref:GNAT family N-acetyltransferase n=2 Tax=Acidithiobacillus sulfuriphilus TaxID=1867749 RepID=A0A3M8RDQ8_9PROT|nr:GNAT family N-acetyltransferase [Acidithiobacillus sulfuriphilus]RNF64390.1 GNAT family N-acetyltransferase [Acidithiobacillus sulfuriphilus]